MTKKNKTETVNADAIIAGDMQGIAKDNLSLRYENKVLKEQIKMLEAKIEKLGELNEQAFMLNMSMSKELMHYEHFSKVERLKI